MTCGLCVYGLLCCFIVVIVVRLGLFWAWVGFMLWYCVDCGLDVVYCFDCWITGLGLVSSGFGFVLLLFVVNAVGGFVWVLWCL